MREVGGQHKQKREMVPHGQLGVGTQGGWCRQEIAASQGSRVGAALPRCAFGCRWVGVCVRLNEPLLAAGCWFGGAGGGAGEGVWEGEAQAGEEVDEAG